MRTPDENNPWRTPVTRGTFGPGRDPTGNQATGRARRADKDGAVARRREAARLAIVEALKWRKQ